MRVLIVAHGFPPSGLGGAELYALAHANALIAAGDTVLVLARESDRRRREFDVRRESRDGVEIAWINNSFASVRSFRDTYTDDRIDAIAAGVIGEFAPDAAHIHHLTCLSTSIVHELAARQVPVFCTLHDYWFLCHRGQLLDRDLRVCADPASCANCLGPEAYASPAVFRTRAALAPVLRFVPDRLLSAVRNGGRVFRPGPREVVDGGRALRPGGTADPSAARRDHMRGVLQGINHFFAPSAYLRDRFVAAGVDPARISVSEYGWSLPGPATTPPQRPSTRPSTPLQVGFIGSLMVSKAPHVLIEAIAALPAGSCVAHIWGGHADYHGDRSYRARLAQLGLPMEAGSIDRNDLRAALAQFDVLVVPSIWPENSPLVIREAFLAGIPVIASRIGGIPETVSDNVNGLLFEPGDAADLTRALRRIIDEPELLPRLRAGIPKVRTVEDDVMGMRAKYALAMPGLKTRPPSATPRRLAAVVLNYNTPDQTFLATRSLLLSRRAIDHVIVVDNSSDDRCRSALAPLLDRVTFIATGRNLGFSGGMNAGITRALDAGAGAVLLVNSDVVVPADCLEALERALYATPGAGIAGPVVLARNAPDRIASLGITYNRTTGRMRHRGVGDAAEASHPAGSIPVSAVSGCLMLVKREVFERMGMFEPGYFFSFEDLDFCLRARDAGFSTILAPAATALHEGGQSMGSDPRRLYFGARNHLWLAQRRGGPGGRPGAALRSLFIVALNVAHGLRAPGGSVTRRMSAVAAGTRDYFRGPPGL
jgi:GT2 family glycosyltransferase/glycosyltransferase involved in cell wall biosynthesis